MKTRVRREKRDEPKKTPTCSFPRLPHQVSANCLAANLYIGTFTDKNPQYTYIYCCIHTALAVRGTTAYKSSHTCSLENTNVQIKIRLMNNWLSHIVQTHASKDLTVYRSLFLDSWHFLHVSVTNFGSMSTARKTLLIPTLFDWCIITCRPFFNWKLMEYT